MSPEVGPEAVYYYVWDNCGCHYIQHQKKWSAHITLGYDYQEYGATEEIAKHNLAYAISKNPMPYYHVRILIHRKNKQS